MVKPFVSFGTVFHIFGVKRLTATAFSDCTTIQWIWSNSRLVTSFPLVLSRYKRRLLTVHFPPWTWL